MKRPKVGVRMIHVHLITQATAIGDLVAENSGLRSRLNEVEFLKQSVSELKEEA